MIFNIFHKNYLCIVQRLIFFCTKTDHKKLALYPSIYARVMILSAPMEFPRVPLIIIRNLIIFYATNDICLSILFILFFRPAYHVTNRFTEMLPYVHCARPKADLATPRNLNANWMNEVCFVCRAQHLFPFCPFLFI